MAHHSLATSADQGFLKDELPKFWWCFFFVYRQNLEWTKSRNGQNPELDKIPNEQNRDWTKSRIGQHPELDKIPNEQNPERKKSRTDKIQNQINF